LSADTVATLPASPPATADAAERLPSNRTGRRARPGPAVWLGGTVVALAVLSALFAPWLAPYPPLKQDLDARLKPPNPTHLLGTDELGRDVLSRLFFGARISLLMAVGSMAVALPLGALCGVAGGFLGGWVDLVTSRAIDILLAFPTTLLALVLIASLGPSPSSVLVALGLAFLPGFARIARGSVLRERGRDYVLAASAIGQSQSGILWRHVRPNITNDLGVQLSIALPSAMLAEAGLSFLGLGVSPADPSWGRMLSNAASVVHTAPHLALTPLIPLIGVVLGFFLLADGTRAWLDPQTRRGRLL
jgi:ABC-type dipeptide/oligopeptide/nickel transport system permease subunit